MRNKLLTSLTAALVLHGCAASHEVSDSDSDDIAKPDDAAELDEETIKPWSPYTVDETRALRDAFSWENTVALPEEPLAQRTPPNGVEKAAISDIASIIYSLASLYYVQIYVNSGDQLRELEEMFVHWDMAPLFDSEIPDQENLIMTFEGDPDDKGGMFIYAFMPAVIYNAIRAEALLGEETYKAMILRPVPLEARAWDGSVRWEYLAGSLLEYAPAHTHLTDEGETALPSVIDEQEFQASQKRFGRRLRRFARRVRDSVRTVVDGVRSGVGELAKLVRPETSVSLTIKVKNQSTNFGDPQRAWDQYGSQPTFAKPISLSGTRVNVTQLGGISLFRKSTNADGKLTVSVPRNRKTRVCVEADSPTATMESGLLWPVRECFGKFTSSGSSQSITKTASDPEFYALALMQDAREFARVVLGHSPRKATIQTGWPSKAIGLVNEDRPFAPCLALTDAPVAVTDTLDASFPGLGAAVELIIASDIVLQDFSLKRRAQPVHEYGHFFMCDLLHSQNPASYNVVWSEFLIAMSAKIDGPVNHLIEGFAEWFSSQVTGGVDYFRLRDLSNRDVTFNSNGNFFFDVSAPGNGFGMEENVGSKVCNTAGAKAFPECQVTQSSVFEGLEEGMATRATLFHDIIDRTAPGTERTGDAAVWTRPTNLQLTSSAWSQNNDEAIELPVTDFIKGMRDFATLALPITDQTFLVPIISRMYLRGYSREQVCKLIRLHRRDGDCPGWVPPNPGDIVVF